MAVPPSDRGSLIAELRRDIARVAPAWSAAVTRAEGLAESETAEEDLAGPYLTLRFLRLLGASLRDIERVGVPRIPGGLRLLADGR